MVEYTEDYEGIAVGSLPTNYANDGVFPAATFSVQNDKSHNGTKSLKLTQTGTTRAVGHWDYSYSGNYYGIWVDVGSTGAGLQRHIITQRVSGNYNNITDEVTWLYIENSDVKAYNGVVNNTIGLGLGGIGWHHVEFFIDFKTNTYSVDWDGSRLATDFGFWCTDSSGGHVDSIESFQWLHFQFVNGDTWFDELELRGGQPYMKRIQGVPGMRTYQGGI